MKKTKINLLSNRQDYTRLERYFLILRIGVLSYAAILLSVIVIFAIFLLNQNNEIQSLLDKKTSSLSSLSTQRTNEAKLIYLSKKMKAYGEFLKEDARFLPYFALLNNTLKTGSQSASLTSFVIDKNRNVEFKLSFSKLEDLLESFQFVESDQFLKNFEQLSLTQFLSQKSSTKKNYEISFEGKFIQVYEKSQN